MHMQGIKYRWRMPTATIEHASELAREHTLPISLVQVLLNRGIDDRDKITDFLFTPYSCVFSAHVMADALKAVERILTAI